MTGWEKNIEIFDFLFSQRTAGFGKDTNLHIVCVVKTANKLVFVVEFLGIHFDLVVEVGLRGFQILDAE